MFGVDKLNEIGYNRIRKLLPARKYLYEVIFPDLTGALLASSAANLTTPAYEADPYSDINTQGFTAGKYSLADFTLTFYESELGTVLDYFNTWMRGSINSIRDTKGYYNIPKYYKKTIRVALISSTGYPYCYFEYKNTWPKSIETLDMDMSAIEALSVSVTFSADDMEIIGLGNWI